jgi:hypothetical protein
LAQSIFKENSNEGDACNVSGKHHKLANPVAHVALVKVSRQSFFKKVEDPMNDENAEKSADELA